MNPDFFKTLIKSLRPLHTKTDALALGCSHTWGVGVESHEAWPHLLNAMNFGIAGCSANLVVRMGKEVLKNNPQVTKVYVLWPDWTRFEYEKDGTIHQSLATDPDRLKLMFQYTDLELKKNFNQQTEDLKLFCQDRDIRLIGISLYDLIPYLDHSSRWPLSNLGHHYAPSWHQKVANIFQNTEINNIEHPLAYD